VETNRTKALLAIGLNADIKLGKKNSYSILRFNGKDREILHDTDAPMELPKWLTPIRGNAKFLEMETGDGRNQALFNHILPLQSANFSIEEARDCIRLINKFILKDPLTESELEVILRDEAFQKPVFFKGNTFLFDKFAVFLKNNCHIIKLNNQLHLYDNGIYVSGKQRIEFEMLKIYPEMNRSKRIEVFDYLNVLVQETEKPMDANLIAFRNGIFDIMSGQLIPFSPDHIITNRIEWDYNPNAKNDLVDEVLNKVSCGDCKIRALLEEIVGYCFYRRNELGKAFILTGDKSNGKSTFLDMIKTVLGERNIAALDLAELNDRFSTVTLFGKLANIGDDIGDEFIPNTGVFKKLVTGEELKGEYKGQDPFFFHSYAKQLFSANNIPRLGKGKDSAAIKRRLIIVPFEARFSVDDPDFKPYIKYDLRKQGAVEYLIILGLAGLKRVLETLTFTNSEKVQKSIDEYEEINNPVIGFFKEAIREEIKIENEPTNEVYKHYQEYCIRSNLQPLSNIEFSKQVKRYFNFEVADKKIQGKKYRIFITGGTTL
jgi:putative DNA primase/helicase